MSTIENNEFELRGRKRQGGHSRTLMLAAGLSVFAHLTFLSLTINPTGEGYQPKHPMVISLVPINSDPTGAETPAETLGVEPESTMATPVNNLITSTLNNRSGSSTETAAGSAATRSQSNHPLPAVPAAPRPGDTTPPIESDLAALSITGGAEPVEENWEAGVRLDLMNWLERHKRYPIAARRKGVQGAVMVRFVVSSDGALLEKELIRSSGSKHLDSAAMQLLTRAAPYPKLPARLLADALEVQLPIEYRLVVGRHRT